jgi:hypothetical protein
VEGNAQGYKITLEGIEEPVPISRNFSAEFSDRLLAMRTPSATPNPLKGALESND